MKTLKDEFKEILEKEPELTILNWAYGNLVACVGADGCAIKVVYASH